MTDVPEMVERLPELHQRAFKQFRQYHDDVPEKIEQIARALARMQTPNTQEVEDQNWPHRIADAVVAIEALREPTDEMYTAACDEIDSWTDPTDGGAIKAAYQAAVDAALGKGQRQ